MSYFTPNLTTLLSCLCLQSLLVGIIGHVDENGSDVVTVIVEQGSEAILPCSLSTKENITSKLFHWKKDGRQEVFFYEAGDHYNNRLSGQDEQFKKRVSHFPEELKSGNASIIIRKTKMEDSGVYTCVFPRLQPNIKRIKLVVERTFEDRSGEITGAARKPCLTIVDQTADMALLQCEVRGAFSKPEVCWQDRAGNILNAKDPKVTERGGGYEVILQTTVTKTDIYRCVAKQEEISHQIDAETFVFISGAASKPCITIANVTEDGVQLKCEVRGAFPQPKLHWRDSEGKVLPGEEPQVSESGGRYSVILQTTVTSTKTNRFSCVVNNGIRPDDHAEITLPDKLFEDKSSHVGWMVFWIGGWFSGILTAAAFWALFKFTKRCKKGCLQTNGNYTSTSKDPI